MDLKRQTGMQKSLFLMNTLLSLDPAFPVPGLRLGFELKMWKISNLASESHLQRFEAEFIILREPIVDS